MTWNVRHEGSPRSVEGLTLPEIIAGLRDGVWEPTDEVMGPQDRKWVAIEAHPALEAVAAEMEPPVAPSHPDETRLDMNALIDVCLVLLIFFILTTTYVSVQKVVPVPVTSDTQKGPIKVVKPGDVQNYMIRVEARLQNGRPSIRVENEPPVPLEGLRRVLERWVKKTKRHEILLDVSGVTWGTAIKIQDDARAAGINKINYQVGKKE
jgi:biopolymer transport protein ExbD